MKQTGQVRWQQKGSHTLSQNDIAKTLVHKGLKIGPEFLSTLRKFCTLIFIARLADGDQQTELNQTLPNGIIQDSRSKSR